MVHAGCIFVAGIRPSRAWMSGSFESVRWKAGVNRQDLDLYSRPNRVPGEWIRTHLDSKGEGGGLYLKFKGGSNPRRCITQDTEPNTLPTELFRPREGNLKVTHAVQMYQQLFIGCLWIFALSSLLFIKWKFCVSAFVNDVCDESFCLGHRVNYILRSRWRDKLW